MGPEFRSLQPTSPGTFQSRMMVRLSRKATRLSLHHEHLKRVAGVLHQDALRLPRLALHFISLLCGKRVTSRVEQRPLLYVRPPVYACTPTTARSRNDRRRGQVF
jgi:hypothetical protein